MQRSDGGPSSAGLLTLGGLLVTSLRMHVRWDEAEITPSDKYRNLAKGKWIFMKSSLSLFKIYVRTSETEGSFHRNDRAKVNHTIFNKIFDIR